MRSDGARDLAALPKGHLHLHLEAAMRPGTLADLCAEHSVEVPEIGGYGDFSAFEATYEAATDVLRREEDVERLVREMLEDARADGAWYVEPALYAPAHRARFGSDEAVTELVLDSLDRFGRDLGVGVGLMISGDRMVDPGECEEQARLAAAYAGRGVVSFGLASDETDNPPEPFAPAFDIARAAGLISAPHAGELAGPPSVVGALEALGADRLQHGVRAIEDAELVGELSARGTCLDVCPTSNAALGVYPKLSDHPLPALLAAGVRCSLNADDPLLFGTGLLDEYELCRAEMGLEDSDLAAIAAASLDASGAPADLIERGLAGISDWLGGRPTRDRSDGPSSAA
jgi:adenosine deaminase